jgi:hypothetical protein
MELVYFFGYLGLAAIFFLVLENFYPFVKPRLIFALSVCWPITITVIAVDEIISYLTSSSPD